LLLGEIFGEISFLDTGDAGAVLGALPALRAVVAEWPAVAPGGRIACSCDWRRLGTCVARWRAWTGGRDWCCSKKASRHWWEAQHQQGRRTPGDVLCLADVAC
jgi:hypothetical protein